MEWHVERFLNRLSLLLAAIATLSLLHLFSHSSIYCSPHPTGPHHIHTHTHTHTPFPSSSCDPSLPSRDLLSLDKRYNKLISSAAFKKRAASFASIFQTLRSLRLLSNSSRVLCVPAGAGHDAFALQDSGVSDVTAVDLVEFPPLVKRSDPHNLPFFDGIFDLGFSAGLDVMLFPRRFAEEMERTVSEGGAEAFVVERLGSEEELEEIKGLFRRSSLVEVRNVTLAGSEMSLIVMRNNGNPS